MNPLFEQMNDQNPYNIFMKQFNEFRKTIKGNPQEQVQQLLNSGKISQQQYDAVVRKAQMLKNMFGL